MSRAEGERHAALRRLAARAVLLLPILAPWIVGGGKTSKGVYRAPSPLYGEAGTCRISLITGEWTDRLPATRGGPAMASGDDVISLIAYRNNCGYVEAAETLIVLLTDDAAVGMFS